LDKGFLGTDQKENGATENSFILQQCIMQIVSERTQEKKGVKKKL